MVFLVLEHHPCQAVSWLVFGGLDVHLHAGLVLAGVLLRKMMPHQGWSQDLWSLLGQRHLFLGELAHVVGSLFPQGTLLPHHVSSVSFWLHQVAFQRTSSSSGVDLPLCQASLCLRSSLGLFLDLCLDLFPCPSWIQILGVCIILAQL